MKSVAAIIGIVSGITLAACGCYVLGSIVFISGLAIADSINPGMY